MVLMRMFEINRSEDSQVVNLTTLQQSFRKGRERSTSVECLQPVAPAVAHGSVTIQQAPGDKDEHERIEDS